MSKPIFTIEELSQITNGEIVGKIDKNTTLSISTDTRTIENDSAYLALCGKVFDGHDFIKMAFEKSAPIAIIDKKHKDLTKEHEKPFLIVEDTTTAYLQIAQFHKNKQKAKIIAITGSSGKTTTKELFYSVFSSKYKTQKSLKNHNNEIGLCQTLLSIESDTEYCIVEMGMRALKEIDLLAKYAQPQIAIITNSGSAHIGILGSLENIAKAKCEITNYLSSDNTLIAHNNNLIKNILSNKNFNKVFYDLNDVEILSKSENKSQFKYRDFVFNLPDSADFNILNSLAVINAAKIENFSNEEIQTGLNQFKNIEFRNEITALKNGAIVVSDCYNANPDSTKAAIAHICEAYKNKKIIIIFGDMLELGEFEQNYHKEIGKLINNTNVNYFISVGKLAKIAADEVINIQKKSFTDTTEAANFLKGIIDQDTVIFLKASRGMCFEKILEMIRG